MTEKLTIRSQSPYYDDFDNTKNYLQVLFRPSFPVQSRELTTLQSNLMEQIARFGQHNFKDGSRVSGAKFDIDNKVNRLYVSGENNALFPITGAASGSVYSDVYQFVDKIISNSSGTIKAQVLSGFNLNDLSFQGDIYLKYITEQRFESGGYIYAKPEDNADLSQTIFTTFNEATEATVGGVSEGVYFIKDIFSYLPQQKVVISKTSASPSSKIGIVAQEKIVTANEDSSLYDNARGTTNEGAPGAHRLTVDLILISGNSSDPNYYRIASVENGVIQEAKKIDSKVSLLEDVLAERTFDESGNYTVTAPISTVIDGSTEDTFVIKTEPFKAYVKGYQVSKQSSTRTTYSKQMENQSTSKNVSLDIKGASYYELSSVTGVLPGQNTTNSPYTYAQRLLMKNSGGDVIGVCRGYAVNDEIERGLLKTKLYIYDIKMFQVITPANTNLLSIADGNDVYTGNARGYAYQTDGTAGVVNGITVISATDAFKAGQTLTSDVVGSSTLISAVTQFKPSDVSTITDTSGSAFVATVSGTIQNANAELLYGFNNRHIKTLKDGSASIMDNDFDIIQYTGSTAVGINTANGLWDKTTVNDQEEINKTMKFAYLRVKGGTSRGASNYGWFAKDKEISLLYPDVHRVYGVNASSDSTFGGGRFTRLNITTTSSIPQGIRLTGEDSGNECIVILQNTTNTYQQVASNTTGFHETQTGTGSSNVIEVIFTKGNSFNDGEALLPRPIEETNSVYSSTTFDLEDVNYNFAITFNQIEAIAVGSNVNSSFKLDNGQRGEYYDVSRIVRKDTVEAPQNDLIVFFSYFESTTASTKHFYSADSYATTDFFDYDTRYEKTFTEIIPRKRNIGIDLRNVLDFRLRVDVVTTDISESPFVFTNRSFYNQSKILPNSRFTTDLTEFLGRIETVYLQKDGTLLSKSGKPSVSPQRPDEETDAMSLMEVYVPPAVRYPEEEVKLQFVDNKRYTMRDIGAIEKRINRIEEAVALSLLESQALYDDVGGRTKTGFVVDDFASHRDFASTPADFKHPEWNASFDTLQKSLIPAQTSGSIVDMVVSSTNNMSSFFTNYYIPEFTEVVAIEQSSATGGYAINPFAVWSYYGDIELTPSIDTWFIRSDNYFTNENGSLQSFVGDENEWENFLNITTASPGGSSETQIEWQTGVVRQWGDFAGTQFAAQNNLTIVDANGWLARTGIRTTITNFDEPRPIDGRSATETLVGTTMIPNLNDYFMRSVNVDYQVSGLAPNTEHFGYFANDKIVETITSDNLGSASGTFIIPPGKYKAGTEEFKIADKFQGDASTATANFTSNGMIQEFNIIQDVSRGGEDTATTDNVVRFTDPIAQLFTLPLENFNGKVERYSSIMTSIDIWMHTVDTRPTKNTVKVEIRESVNGYPGGPDKIIGSSDFVTVSSAEEIAIPSSTNSKNIKFRQPVKLESNKEYAIVILSPSDAMKVWVASLGDVNASGTSIHSDQPNVGGYYGSFFVSQNGSTWNAEQNIDLTFKLNRAEFSTAVESSVIYNNVIQDGRMFRGDVGLYHEGQVFETFENSNYVMVHHPNHGLNFASAKANITVPAGTHNGISDSDLNGVHDVHFPTLDTFFIKTNDKATTSGKISTDQFSTFSTQCVVYDGMLTNIKTVQSSTDNVKLEIKTTETNSSNFTISGDKISNPDLIVPTTSTQYVEVPAINNIKFDNPQIVRNITNTTTNDLSLKLTLTSTNPYSAPFWRKDISQAPALYRNITGYLLDDSDMDGLTVTTVTDSDNDDTNQKLASHYAGRSSLVENTAYVTKLIDIEVPADGLTLFFDAQMFTENEIEIYFKARIVGEDTPFDGLEWIRFDNSEHVNETNYGKFSNDSLFKSYEARATTGFDFSAFKVKFVMKTPNEALVPAMKNLRIIADV